LIAADLIAFAREAQLLEVELFPLLRAARLLQPLVELVSAPLDALQAETQDRIIERPFRVQ
jgi:hypothetical protein